MAGNLTFSWNPKYEDSKCYDVSITRNTTQDWRRTNDTKLTIGDVMLYDRIKIVVRTGRSEGYNDNEIEYPGLATFFFLEGGGSTFAVHSLQLTLIYKLSS